jgi:hypothetical protein
MAAPDDPPPWPTAKVVEHFVEHFRWDSEPHTAFEGLHYPRLDLGRCPAIPGSSARPGFRHDGPPRAANASSIRRYMRPPTSPPTRLNPNFV